MTRLYSSLAQVYHEMYQSLFDYKYDFTLYDKFLRKHKCKKILEIGCGTGHLTSFFLNKGYNYTGLDLSRHMLAIAKKNNVHNARFICGDMRHLKGKEKYDAILITGRSFTHLITNTDVLNTLSSVYHHLHKNGILIFDNFNAASLISLKKKRFIQKTRFLDTTYKRISEKYPNLATGWTENWHATYFITKKGKTKIVKDSTTIRSFTGDELFLFLKLSHLKVISHSKKDSTLFTVAKRL